MGIFDFLNTKKYKTSIAELEKEIQEIKNTFTPEMFEVDNLRKISNSYSNEIEEKKKSIGTLNQEITNVNNKISDLKNQINDLNNQIVILNDDINIQEFGLYHPRYDFQTAAAYNEQLTQIRQTQKNLIKNDKAVLGTVNWTVNGKESLGKKMVKDIQKLLLRAFNSECDDTISKVKYSNLEQSAKKINLSRETIAKLGKMLEIQVSNDYFNSKISELYLAFEYQEKKQQEKEDLKEARLKIREEAKLQKELEEAKSKITKEQNHYQNALQKLNKQLEVSSEVDKENLLLRKSEIENQLTQIENNLKDIDYREANQRAGYVYIISNIGAFGENTYKIGMTRRLDPQERVDELGDASVPFNFDVHAMIFTEDAPKLENALHKAFENRKLNMINQRREFFNVSLDEIKKVISDNFDKTVDFIDVPDAEQYRVSLKMKAL